MGYCKVVNRGAGKVVLVHQLGSDGVAYAEDVTFEVQAGVDPSRLDGLAQQDGQVVTFSWSLIPATGDTSSIQFPSVLESPQT